MDSRFRGNDAKPAVRHSSVIPSVGGNPRKPMSYGKCGTSYSMQPLGGSWTSGITSCTTAATLSPSACTSKM